MDKYSQITDSSNDRKYYTQLPNLIDELDLSPLAIAMYFHYKRKAGANGGKVRVSNRVLAKKYKVGLVAISDGKKELFDANVINIEKSESQNLPDKVIVLDIWKSNILHFSSDSNQNHYPLGDSNQNRLPASSDSNQNHSDSNQNRLPASSDSNQNHSDSNQNRPLKEYKNSSKNSLKKEKENNYLKKSKEDKNNSNLIPEEKPKSEKAEVGNNGHRQNVENLTWSKFISFFENEFDKHIFDAWFNNLKFLNIDESEKILIIESQGFVKDWINSNYSEILKLGLESAGISEFKIKWRTV